MHAPSRGGTRGGRDQFSWEDVKADKDREAYLGHTLMAPVGKWRQGKDLLWYSRERETQQQALEQQLKEERQHIRREEEDKRRALLGLPPLRPKAEQSQHETRAKEEGAGGDGSREEQPAAVGAQRLLLKGSFVGGARWAERTGGRLEPMDSAVLAEEQQAVQREAGQEAGRGAEQQWRPAEAQRTEDGSKQRLRHGGEGVDQGRRTEREARGREEGRRERRRSRRHRQQDDDDGGERQRRRRSRESRAPSRSRSPRRPSSRRSASPSPSSSAPSPSRPPSPTRSSGRRR